MFLLCSSAWHRSDLEAEGRVLVKFDAVGRLSSTLRMSSDHRTCEWPQVKWSPQCFQSPSNRIRVFPEPEVLIRWLKSRVVSPETLTTLKSDTYHISAWVNTLST